MSIFRSVFTCLSASHHYTRQYVYELNQLIFECIFDAISNGVFNMNPPGPAPTAATPHGVRDYPYSMLTGFIIILAGIVVAGRQAGKNGVKMIPPPPICCSTGN